MTRYCTRVIGDYRRVEKSRAFVCDTDEDAIVWATQLLDDQTVELWSGKRLVRRLLPPAPSSADGLSPRGHGRRRGV
jgi:hypothetical protein